MGGPQRLLDYLIRLVISPVVSNLWAVLAWWTLRLLGKVTKFLWCTCVALPGPRCRLTVAMLVIVVTTVRCLLSECVPHRQVTFLLASKRAMLLLQTTTGVSGTLSPCVILIVLRALIKAGPLFLRNALITRIMSPPLCLSKVLGVLLRCTLS